VTKDPQVVELSNRARKLIGMDYGVYEHPKFFVSINDDRIYVGLNKAGSSHVSVYWESNQLLPPGAKGFQVDLEWVPETLSWMRQAMVLDDLASI
jgi:TfoX/Sxy family transcriptional regulator of competence genes